MRIQVSRDKGRFGRFRKLELHVDDEHLFDIEAGEAMIIDIPPNAKTIHGKMDWLEMNLLSLENIGAGEQIKIEGPSFWDAAKVRPGMKSLPIRLRRDEKEETTSYLGNRQERT